MHKYSKTNKKTWAKYLQNDWIEAVILYASDSWTEIVALNENKDGAIILADGINGNYTTTLQLSKEKFEDRYGIALYPSGASKREGSLNELLNEDIENLKVIGGKNLLDNFKQSVNNAIVHEFTMDKYIVAVSLYDMSSDDKMIIAQSTTSHSTRIDTSRYVIHDMYSLKDGDKMEKLDTNALNDILQNDKLIEILEDRFEYSLYATHFNDKYRIVSLDLAFDTEAEAQVIIDAHALIQNAKVERDLKHTRNMIEGAAIKHRRKDMSPEERQRDYFAAMAAMNKKVEDMYASHTLREDKKEVMANFVRGNKKY